MLPPKAAPQSCCSSKQLFPKIIPESLPKLLPKAVPRSCFPKLFPKPVPQSTSAKRLHQSGYASNQFPKAILQSGSRKLLPKVAAESYSPKLRSKVGSPKVLPKVAVLQSCRTKSCSSKLLPKAVPRHCPTKLCPKAVLQSCCPQSCDSANLFTKTAPQSHSAKRLTKLRPKVSCYQKLLSKTIAPKLRFFKPRPQNGSPKLFCKAAPESCYWKLLPEVVCVQPYNIGISSNNKLRTCRYTLRLTLLRRNSEQPCGLRQGHRHRINMTKCVAI